MSDSTFPVVEPPFPEIDTESSLAGVILAAGTSSRFGSENKLLIPVDGTPLVRRAVAPFIDVLDRVFVVLGYMATEVREAVADLPVTCVLNRDYADGQATSVRRGLAAIGSNVNGVVIGLGDMPAINPTTVSYLCEAFDAGAGDPVAAAFNENRGNPVLFGSQHFDKLHNLTGDTGARSILFSSKTTVLVETNDPGVRKDIDSRDDL